MEAAWQLSSSTSRSAEQMHTSGSSLCNSRQLLRLERLQAQVGRLVAVSALTHNQCNWVGRPMHAPESLSAASAACQPPSCSSRHRACEKNGWNTTSSFAVSRCSCDHIQNCSTQRA